MRAGDVPAGKHEVRHVHGIEAVIRNTEILGSLVLDADDAPLEECLRIVVVECPSAVSHDILEMTS